MCFHCFLFHYSHSPHNDVSGNDGSHIRRWSHFYLFIYLFIYFFFFCIHCRGSYESQHTTHIKGGMRQKGREWEAQNSGDTETLGDLWKGEGWDGEHGVYKIVIHLRMNNLY